MVDITIVNGVYKPTYNYGAPQCINVNIINNVGILTINNC